jgi:hypothetical protein
MRRPTAPQIELARRLFALEAPDAADAAECAAAAGRVHEKILSRLAVLIGASGARALFVRTLKLTAVERPSLGQIVFDAKSAGSEPLVQCLRAEPPAVARETAVALYATLLSLLETLIGQRLTANVLRSAWPGFDATNQETK